MTSDETESTPSFEETLLELEQIVARMEDGSLGLDESLRQFEQATKLLRQCHGLLQHAEQRIELLTGFDQNGNERTEEFGFEAAPQDGQTESSDPSQDDATLF